MASSGQQSVKVIAALRGIKGAAKCKGYTCAPGVKGCQQSVKVIAAPRGLKGVSKV